MQACGEKALILAAPVVELLRALTNCSVLADFILSYDPRVHGSFSSVT